MRVDNRIILPTIHTPYSCETNWLPFLLDILLRKDKSSYFLVELILRNYNEEVMLQSQANTAHKFDIDVWESEYFVLIHFVL